MPDTAIGHVAARAFEIPTDQPEADGTLSWDKTTIVVVEIAAGGATGLAYPPAAFFRLAPSRASTSATCASTAALLFPLWRAMSCTSLSARSI